jgi:hypothetical protein
MSKRSSNNAIAFYSFVLIFLISICVVKPTLYLGLAIVCIVIGIAVEASSQPKKPFKAKYQPSRNYYPKAPNDAVNSFKSQQDTPNKLPDDFEPTVRHREINQPYAEKELRNLVKNDQAVDRLLKAAMDKYTDKGYLWYIDKVLSDWLRDRR